MMDRLTGILGTGSSRLEFGQHRNFIGQSIGDTILRMLPRRNLDYGLETKVLRQDSFVSFLGREYVWVRDHEVVHLHPSIVSCSWVGIW